MLFGLESTVAQQQTLSAIYGDDETANDTRPFQGTCVGAAQVGLVGPAWMTWWCSKINGGIACSCSCWAQSEVAHARRVAGHGGAASDGGGSTRRAQATRTTVRSIGEMVECSVYSEELRLARPGRSNAVAACGRGPALSVSWSRHFPARTRSVQPRLTGQWQGPPAIFPTAGASSTPRAQLPSSSSFLASHLL